jgi:putative endonuclease
MNFDLAIQTATSLYELRARETPESGYSRASRTGTPKRTKAPRHGTFSDNARQIFHAHDEALTTMPWFLYLIECDDGSLYTGIATDVQARFDAHASGKGARYTRSRKPLAVVASFELAGRSEASRAEYRVKRLKAHQKRALVSGERTLDSVMPSSDATEPPKKKKRRAEEIRTTP